VLDVIRLLESEILPVSICFLQLESLSEHLGVPLQYSGQLVLEQDPSRPCSPGLFHMPGMKASLENPVRRVISDLEIIGQ
jgi:hypothetical protein